MLAPRRVVIVGFDGVEILDVTGPASVFATATRLLGREQRGYAVEITAPRAGTFATLGEVRLGVDQALTEVRGAIDTLVIAGGDIDGPALNDDALAAAIGRAAKRSRRIASVCTGAFLLARAGLLEGKRATTHWFACRALEERYPGVRVEEDPIFVRDGEVWTSAGVTAGIDLCLALIEEDHGRTFALSVARWLVLYLRRPGGQSQFSVSLGAQCAEREPLRDLQAWIGENLSANLGVDALAQRVHMSPRNFARVFRREVGTTPAGYVESVRVEAARRALEATRQSLKRIAADTGLGGPETLGRVFKRRLGVSPHDYRLRFSVVDSPR
jgi:transcriptional regulator GlxA family with amidase domain